MPHWVPQVRPPRVDKKEISERRVIRSQQHATPTASDVAYAAKVTCLADLDAEQVQWLWRDVIPLGKITTLTGNAGVGKTFLTLEIAAEVTRGQRMPDGVDNEEPGNVMLISYRDDLAKVVVPRLKQAGADLARVNALRGVCRRNPKSEDQTCWLFQLNEDLRLLELEIGRQKTEDSPLRLMIIDPFPLHLFSGRKGVPELMSTITHLAEIAAWSETAILLVAETSNEHRRSDVISDLENAVRSSWSIEHDIDVLDRRLLLPVKTNLREKETGLAFRIQDGKVIWEPDPVAMTAKQYRTESSARTRTSFLNLEWSELARARDWLQQRLKSQVVPMRIVKQEAAANDIAYTTLCRAFCGLRGISRRIEGTRSWEWSLPKSDVTPALVPHWCTSSHDDVEVSDTSCFR